MWRGEWRGGGELEESVGGELKEGCRRVCGGLKEGYTVLEKLLWIFVKTLIFRFEGNLN